MNRNDEYFELLEKLDRVSVPEKCVKRAVRRKRISSFVTKPLVSIAVFFLAFVLLVNVSPTVAQALEGIPVLGDMTRALRFSSRAVYGAVKNDYYQPLNISAEDGDIKLDLQYLVADEENLTVAFDVKCENHEKLYFYCTYGTKDESVLLYCSGSKNHRTASTAPLVQEGKYPESGKLTFEIYDHDELLKKWLDMDESVPLDSISEMTGIEPIAEFSFDVTVDKSIIGKAKHYDVDAVCGIEGQRIRITKIDMYPTFTAVTVEQDKANDAWVGEIEFTLTDDDKNVYLRQHKETVTELFCASGDSEVDRNETSVYYAESMYFSNTKNVTFHATGCMFIDKGAYDTEIDLATGELTVPTDVIEVIEAKKDGRNVYVRFSVPVASQFDHYKFEKFGTFETVEEDLYIYNSKGEIIGTKDRNTLEFRSDNYTSDRLKLDFYFTGSWSASDDPDWPNPKYVSIPLS